MVTETPAPFALHTATFLQAQAEPIFFCREIIGVEPWDYQLKILHDLGLESQVAAHTGHGIGKTSLGSWALLWFIFTRNESKVITTAPTWRQVADLLWSEVHKWARKMDLEKMGWTFPYKLLDTRLEVEQEWYAVGESTDEPEKIEGYHAPSIMYITDESKAIPDKIFDSMAGGMTSAESKHLMLSTPGASQGKFYRVCTNKAEKGDWKIHHVDAEDVAVSTNGVQVSKKWIENRKKVWGPSSGIYQLRVKGLFVDMVDDRFCPASWVERAMSNVVKSSKKAKKIMAVDPARYGPDLTVVGMREGMKVLPMLKADNTSVPKTEQIVYDEFLEHRPSEVIIDIGGGLGAGIYDHLLRRSKIRDHLKAFDGANAANDPDMYMNRRAESYWNLRTLLGEGDMQLPYDESIEGQLTGMRYEYRAHRGNTVIKMESKEDMRKRGMISPNEADTLMMLFSDELLQEDAPGIGIWV